MIILSLKAILSMLLLLKPEINKDYAKELAKEIRMNSQRYGIDTRIAVAVMFYESSFKKHPRRCNIRRCTYDIGIMQINHKVWRRVYAIDKRKLDTDFRYNMDIGFRILKHYRHRYSRRESTWWGRYHSGTPKLRKRYERNVKNILKKLESINYD